MIDIEECWDLIYDLWNELDLEHVLAEIWPVERRWQLDLLAARIERMDEAVTEMALDRLLALALADDDDECVASLESERANGDFVRERKIR
jgi:hypothetical protein